MGSSERIGILILILIQVSIASCKKKSEEATGKTGSKSNTLIDNPYNQKKAKGDKDQPISSEIEEEDDDTDQPLSSEITETEDGENQQIRVKRKYKKNDQNQEPSLEEIEKEEKRLQQLKQDKDRIQEQNRIKKEEEERKRKLEEIEKAAKIKQQQKTEDLYKKNILEAYLKVMEPKEIPEMEELNERINRMFNLKLGNKEIEKMEQREECFKKISINIKNLINYKKEIEENQKKNIIPETYKMIQNLLNTEYEKLLKDKKALNGELKNLLKELIKHHSFYIMNEVNIHNRKDLCEKIVRNLDQEITDKIKSKQDFKLKLEKLIKKTGGYEESQNLQYTNNDISEEIEYYQLRQEITKTKNIIQKNNKEKTSIKKQINEIMKKHYSFIIKKKLKYGYKAHKQVMSLLSKKQEKELNKQIDIISVIQEISEELSSKKYSGHEIPYNLKDLNKDRNIHAKKYKPPMLDEYFKDPISYSDILQAMKDEMQADFKQVVIMRSIDNVEIMYKKNEKNKHFIPDCIYKSYIKSSAPDFMYKKYIKYSVPDLTCNLTEKEKSKLYEVALEIGIDEIVDIEKLMEDPEKADSSNVTHLKRLYKIANARREIENAVSFIYDWVTRRFNRVSHEGTLEYNQRRSDEALGKAIFHIFEEKFVGTMSHKNFKRLYCNSNEPKYFLIKHYSDGKREKLYSNHIDYDSIIEEYKKELELSDNEDKVLKEHLGMITNKALDRALINKNQKLEIKQHIEKFITDHEQDKVYEEQVMTILQNKGYYEDKIKDPNIEQEQEEYTRPDSASSDNNSQIIDEQQATAEEEYTGPESASREDNSQIIDEQQATEDKDEDEDEDEDDTSSLYDNAIDRSIDETECNKANPIKINRENRFKKIGKNIKSDSTESLSSFCSQGINEPNTGIESKGDDIKQTNEIKKDEIGEMLKELEGSLER